MREKGFLSESDNEPQPRTILELERGRCFPDTFLSHTVCVKYKERKLNPDFKQIKHPQLPDCQRNN